jgi:UDP-N-acetylmuramate: L-alanyl-gamma-D-glutamyl-meso-diaminopimelate ligase
MQAADEALVYFSPAVVAHKKLPELTKDEIQKAFGNEVNVVDSTQDVLSFIRKHDLHNSVLLMMSSGTFDGIDYDQLGEELKASIANS